MRTLLRRSLATPILLLLVAAPAASQIVSYHDVSSATHQANFNNLYAQGYRLKSLSVYGVSLPVYAAVWSKESGPSWAGFHDASPSEYQTLYNTYTAQGYRPDILTAMGWGSTALLAGTFVKDGLSHRARHGIDQQTFWDECRAAKDNGKMLTWAAVYGTAGTPEYAGVWTENVNNTSWWISLDASASAFQKRFNAFGQVAVRPHFVTLSTSQSYLAIWHDDLIGNWICDHTQTSAGYTTNTQNYIQSGYYALVTQAAGPSASAVFATVFVKGETITPRVPTTTGVGVGALAGFDVYVYQLMRANNIRAGSLAIARDGDLVYARGFTLAEPGYPITQPTDLFRIASCTKPLTSIAIHREFERPMTPLASWQTVPLVFNVPASSVFAQQLFSTTLDHLLGHLGGWDVSPSGLNYDPMFHDYQVSAAQSVPLPISKRNIFDYMTTSQPMQFQPGSMHVYSNYGFSLLGQALERVNSTLSSMTYEQIVHRDIFAPLGVTRPRIGASLQSGRMAGEVLYHCRAPKVASSKLDPSNSSGNPNNSWVPEQYGGWNQGNLDAHGGWVMAAPDFAKVLAAFDQPTNPLLTSTSVTTMWSNPATPPSIKPDLLRGWFSLPLPDETGTLRPGAWHNGGLPGTAGLVYRRDDGLSFVLFFNGDMSMGNSVPTALNQIANTVTSWPTKDLFPSVGIPSFPSRISLTRAVVGTLPNVTKEGFDLEGEDLNGATEVHFEGTRITSTSPGSWANGYFRVVSDTRILVYPPQALPPGPYSVAVSDGATTSNALQVTLTETITPTLEGPPLVAAGAPSTLFATKDPTLSAGTLILLAAGTQQMPSVLPNFLSLGIGNQFQSIFFWPFAIGVNPASGAASFSLPSQPALVGVSIYFQGIVVDPTGGPLPLPTTNVAPVTF